MALLAVENLTFSYPGASQPVLREVSLQVEAGEYLCLCGRSGCGKTTLLRHFKGVLAPHGERTGRVLFDGAPLDALPPDRQSARIGFVMQDPDAQIVTDTVWHELAFGLESLGCPQDAMRLRVAEMASYFGMQDWFRRSVHTLSGGQKQLLNLASIMVMQPDVLVLDEPTAQLDPIAAMNFLATVRRINLELGCTVVIAEHRLEEVYACADTVAVMDEGRITVQGDPRSVAAALYATDDAMTLALPAPVRIFHGVEGAGEGRPVPAAPAVCGASPAVPGMSPAGACPLTVREGRAWLDRRIEAVPPAQTALPAPPLAQCSRGDAALQASGLWFRYGRDLPDVLRGVDLHVSQGELCALVGGNGAGKSTLLRCLCGAARAYRGSVRVLGRKLGEWRERDLFQGGMALLPQDPQNIFVKESVRADLLEMLADGPLAPEAREEAIGEVARKCAVEGVLDRHPYDLSGGELQRAALAKVLLTRPRILLLDEPTKGIDSFYKRTLAGVLRGLCDEGAAILMVSHDVEFCACYAHRVSMLFDGSIAATDNPRRFFGGNGFYTTAANRMSRGLFEGAITDEDVIGLCCS